MIDVKIRSRRRVGEAECKVENLKDRKRILEKAKEREEGENKGDNNKGEKDCDKAKTRNQRRLWKRSERK